MKSPPDGTGPDSQWNGAAVRHADTQRVAWQPNPRKLNTSITADGKQVQLLPALRYPTWAGSRRRVRDGPGGLVFARDLLVSSATLVA